MYLESVARYSHIKQHYTDASLGNVIEPVEKFVTEFGMRRFAFAFSEGIG